MNLILINKNDFISRNTVEIKGRRAKHIFSVHRAVKGKELNIGLINGKLGKGVVIELNSELIKLNCKFNQTPPSPIPLTLILALPRPKTFKKAIHAAITLGVKKIYIIESWKVDKSYWQSPVITTEQLNEQIVLALEQSKDTIFPDIAFKRRFKPFVEDELAKIIRDTTPLLAHPNSTEQCPYNSSSPITLAIGPEGGFTEYEVQSFEKQGFTSVSIGPRILRVEYAIPALINRII